MQVHPYLFFDGRCDEALAFYAKAVGAKVTMAMRFKDAPDQSMVAPGTQDKIMHAQFQLGDSTIMASDGRCSGAMKFEGFTLTVAAKDEAEADKVFGALSDSGTVTMPIAKTFFSPRFGMLTDKFGVRWMLNSDSGQAPKP